MSAKKVFKEALIVDANKCTAYIDFIEDKLESFYKIINTDCITIVARKIDGIMTKIICDEEGKLKQNQIQSACSIHGDECLVGTLIIFAPFEHVIKNIDKNGCVMYDTKR